MATFMEWLDKRLPVTAAIKGHVTEYYAPKNFNFWYFFGSLALLAMVIQILSGIFLTMFYKPDAEKAFLSVEFIMRDVQWGWLIRYMHTTGASMIFLVVYLHMFRGLMYGSYKKPRELLWVIGMVLYLLLTAEAFMGYLLPWGQMSYWGAEVILSLFGAIPVAGPEVAEWIRGGFVANDATINRFLSFHVILIPLILVGLVVLHILALHHVGSNNPDGIEIKDKKGKDGHPVDGIPFHPYYTVKDNFGVTVFLILFCAVMFFAPEMWGYFLEHDNFVPADPMKTPEHIKPLWYLTPFYAILRSVPDKLLGVLAMGAAIFALFLVPWLDRSPVRSWRYRPIYRWQLLVFAVSFVGLGYLGTQPADNPVFVAFARVFSILYFLFFITLPFLSKIERPKPVPERVTM